MALRRHAGVAGYAVASTAAIAILSRLRAQAPAQAVTVPQFILRPLPSGEAVAWPAELPRKAFRQALAAVGLALLVLAIVTTIPAWPFLNRGGSEAATSTALRSSVGVTGTATTRVPDLSVSTFVGQIPFVQQARYLSILTGSAPAVEQFLVGARQATVVRYLQQVNTNVALPYLSDAVATKQAIDGWATTQRQAQEQAARAAAAGAAAPRAAWQAPPVADGTKLSSTVTFYACIGDNGFCGHMANGQTVFPGAAACSTNMPMGTRFVIDADPSQRVFTCLDRGALAATWVDIWFYDAADGWAWQAIVGTHSTITIVP